MVLKRALDRRGGGTSTTGEYGVQALYDTKHLHATFMPRGHSAIDHVDTVRSTTATYCIGIHHRLQYHHFISKQHQQSLPPSLLPRPPVAPRYWNFRAKRSWQKQQQGEEAAPAPQQAGFKKPEARENLRTQLAGLRHRAAVRANRRHEVDGSMWTSSSDESDAEEQPQAVASACYSQMQPQAVASACYSQAPTMAPQPPMQPQPQAAPSCGQSQGPPAAAAEQPAGADGCGSAGQQEAGGAAAGSRRFTNNSSVHEAVSHQLLGLRRKESIKKGQTEGL